jgi:cytochrome c-type biogenesis protein CcmH
MDHRIDSTIWGIRRSRVSTGFLLTLLWCLFLVSGATGEAERESEPEPIEPFAEAPALSPEMEQTAQRIFNELIAPCCWTTTVAQHGSGAAPRIQAEVRHMLAAGMTYQEIIDHYVNKYGERILAKPKKRGFNLAAYWAPYLALALGVIAIALVIGRGVGRRRGAARAAVDGIGAQRATPPSQPAELEYDEYRRRIEDELRRIS